MADNFKFVQTQSTTLAGAGATISDTSIVLASFQTIDGVNLAMTDFGSIGYMTLEPNSGTQEEQISFTGITQNANGTATLTGVSTVLFISPYTETSGLAKTHAGGTKAIVTNTAGFYNRLTGKDDDETINGIWTFVQPPISATNPTGSTQVANKAYVDGVAVAGAPNADLTTKGIIEIATTAEINSGSTTGGTGASIVMRPDQFVASNIGLAAVGNNTDIAVGTGNKFVTQTGLQHNAEKYAADAQGSDTYVITLSPVPTSYTNGMIVYFKANTTNTGAASINVNSLGAKTIVKGVNTTLANNDILAGQFCTIIYDGTNFVLQNPVSTNQLLLFKTGNFTHDMTSGTATVIAHGLGVTPKVVRMSMVQKSTPSGAGTGPTVQVVSYGVYDGTTQNCNYVAVGTNGGPFYLSTQDITHIIHYGFSSTTAGADSDRMLGAVSVDATNITVTWTNDAGSPTGIGDVIWEVAG